MSACPKIMLVSVLCWFAAGAVTFAFPVQVPYSGQLSENGELFHGVKQMKFEIFDAEKGGVSRYESGAALVVVNRGLFAMVLGGTNFAALDSGVFDGTSRWLEISVAPTNSPDFTILQPRQLVHFMPQSAYAVAAGLANQAALAERVAADSVSSSNLANGAVTLTKLSTAGAQPGQFLNTGQDGSTAQWAYLTLNPGPGLKGGGSNWPVSLQLDFGTNGVAQTAARSDHDHQNLTNRGMFTVQYRETDFAFASRLMEEEGIYYYFKMNNAEKKVVMGAEDLRLDRAGPSVELRAGDGLGVNQPGGHIMLRPGLGAGGGSGGKVLVGGDLEASGVISAAGFKGSGAGLTGVNAAQLGGVPDADFARLSVSNRFTAPVVFSEPLRLEKNLFLQLEMENIMVSSFFFGPGSEPFTNVPLLLNLEAQTVANTLNIHDGAGVRIKAGDALSGTARAGDIQLVPGDHPAGGGSAGKVIAGGDLVVTGAVSAASFNGNGAGLTGVNAVSLAGLPSADFARLSASNRFASPVVFSEPVRLEKNLFLQLEMENTMVSSYSFGPGSEPFTNVPPLLNLEAQTVANTLNIHDGAGVRIKAGDALSNEGRGGDIQLLTGHHPSGGGSAGKVLMGGDLVVTGAVSATRFNGNGAGLTGVNAAQFDGVPVSAFARLSASNQFAAPVVFKQPVTHASNMYFQVEFENTLVSSYSIHAGPDPRMVPTESVSLSFEAVSYTNLPPYTNGAGFRFKAADAVAAGSRGGDIRLTAGDGGEGGAGGQIILESGRDIGSGGPGKLVLAQNMLTVGASLMVSNHLTVLGGATVAGTLTAGAIATTNPTVGTVAKPGMAAMSATPSVANTTVLLLNNYFSPLDITNLLDGVEGQVVVLAGGNNPVPPVVRDNNSPIPGSFKLGRDLDWQALPDSTLTLCLINGQWLETARSDNSTVISQ